MIINPLKKTAQLINVLLLIAGSSVYGQRPLPPAYGDIKVNYVRAWTATAPQQDANILMNRPLREVLQSTQYLDGLGRPLQAVTKEGSLETGDRPSDLVNTYEYDSLGRENFKYGLFAANSTGGNQSLNDGKFKINPFEQQAAFMQSQYGSQGERYFYSRTVYEASPLNRMDKMMPPGNSWAGSDRGSEAKYWFNTKIDDVRIWKTEDEVNGWSTYTGSETYGPGELFKHVSLNEHSRQVIEFKDKDGKMILKKVQDRGAADSNAGSSYGGWLCTYYIYDDLGLLRCVIQPKGTELLSSSGWILTLNILNEQCFRYEYNNRGKMIRKKLPGTGETWMVYDNRDRLVMTQDGNMRNLHQWLYITYDNMNRPVSTGLLTDAANYNNLSYHLQNAGGSNNYPDLNAYTTEEMTRNFYEDYNWLSQYGNPLTGSYNNSWDTYLQISSNTWPYAQANAQTPQLKGMPTGTRVKVLGTNIYLYTLNIYDAKGRVIQCKSKNITGGTDILTTQYNWSGQPLMTVQFEEKSGVNDQASTVISHISYDDLRRVIKTEQKVANSKVNAGAVPAVYKIISDLQYNKPGQLKNKALGTGSGPDNGPVENLKYEYNIRGWLLGVNRDYAKDLNNSNYFGFDMGYDKANNGLVGNQLYTNPQYNGNLGGMLWKSKGDGEKRKYDFSYDGVNRLAGADFNQYSGGSFNKTAGIDFSVSNLGYDANGNIQSMIQTGLKLTGSSVIDKLSYTYQPNSNKLSKVTDGIAGDNKLGDFKDGTNTDDDYKYDVNGSLVTDNNKNISSVIYNHLGLPSAVTITGKGTISYVYDAAGNKLKKITVDNTSVPAKTTTTLYLETGIYQNDTLQFISHEEGRIRYKEKTDNAPAGFHYDYMLKDHLGNVRMVLTEEQRKDVYPPASMEIAQGPVENLYYSNIESTRARKPSGYPNDPFTNPNEYAAKLKGDRNKLGPSMILKVMSGDKFDIRVSSWYRTGGIRPGLPNPLTELAGALAGSAAGASGGKVSSNDLISNGISGAAAGSFLENQSLSSSEKPKAYVNWILLDEQFKIVRDGSGSVTGSGCSGFEQVGADAVLTSHVFTDRSVSRSGYLYVYVSNQTPNIEVYFDNLQVTHSRGAMLEETHYYPFGLTMSGISSKASAFGKENKFKYNGKELQSSEFTDGGGLELYDYGKRMQDPQLGLWWVPDPKAELLEMSSPYVFCYNNPVIYKDPDGELAIMINGRVPSESMRGNATYWDNGVIQAIKNSGIPNSNNMIFVDGDRYYKPPTPILGHDFGGESGIKEGSVRFGNEPGSRKQAGYMVGKDDFNNILSRLAKDPATGKIIEKIEIYTHSRGAAFGTGYVKAMLEMIKQNADKFADPDNVIDLIYNMAPHQSDLLEEPGKLNAYSHDHTKDPLSGNDMKGLKGAFKSNENSSGFLGSHSTASFVKDVTAFTASFLANGNNSTKLIEDFIKKMKDDYGVTVTVSQ